MMRDVSLQTDFCGLELMNPFLLAPTPATSSGDMIQRAFDLGWAGAVWKTIGVVPHVSSPKVNPRYLALRGGGHDPFGFGNIDLGNEHSYEKSFREMRQVKEQYPGRLVIASIRGGSDRSAWQNLARRAEEAGADVVEAMFSCPHDTDEDVQASANSWAITTGRIVTWVREATCLPVTVKMSPNVSSMRPVARSAWHHGAAGVSVANTIRCLGGVNLDTLRPLPTVGGLSTYGGYSGPGVKPIIMGFVAELATDEELGLSISGAGGVVSWRDAVEYLLLGASSVQVGTGVMLYGYRIIDDLLDGLRSFMDAHGFSNVASAVGVSLQYLVQHQRLDRDHKMVPHIDLEMCARCGNCYVACLDAGYQAIDLEADRLPRVDSERCVGCGLCAEACPLLGCISLEPVSS
jgi:dihydropyrimidine dehydrogenase (NAD+) subunit PreA